MLAHAIEMNSGGVVAGLSLPMRAEGARKDPLLVSLPDFCPNDPDGVFDGLILTMLTSSSWDPVSFSRHNGVNNIRQKIHTETLRQYGSHIATTEPGYLAARLDLIRKIQKEWDTVAKEGKQKHTPWEPPKPPNHLQLTKSQGDTARKKNDRRQVQIHGTRGTDQRREQPHGR